MTKILTMDAIARLSESWTRETAMNPEIWEPSNPSKNQCAVTAAFLWERFGIPVVRGRAILANGTTDSHYWNQGIDLTRQQFSDETRFEVRDGPQGEEAYAYLLTNPDLVKRLELLRARYDAA
jgi:hypothetical protein